MQYTVGVSSMQSCLQSKLSEDRMLKKKKKIQILRMRVGIFVTWVMQ